METIIELFDKLWPVLVAIGGGIGTVYAWFYNFQRQTKSSIDEKIKVYYEKIIADAEHIKKENVKLLETIQKLSVDHAVMQSKWELIVGSDPNSFTVDRLIEIGKTQREAMDFLKEFTVSFPGMLWIKKRLPDGTWTMYSLSRVYAETYLGRSPDFYVGKSDSEIWGDTVAAIFKKGDDAAYHRGVAIQVEEPLTSPHTGKSGVFKGWKWTLKIDDEIYSCGYGTHYDVPAEENNVESAQDKLS